MVPPSSNLDKNWHCYCNNTRNQPTPSKFAAFGKAFDASQKGSVIRNIVLPSIPSRPKMAAEKVGQFIIMILDPKYIFSPPEIQAKCNLQQEGSPASIPVMFTCVYISYPKGKHHRKCSAAIHPIPSPNGCGKGGIIYYYDTRSESPCHYYEI